MSKALKLYFFNAEARKDSLLFFLPPLFPVVVRLNLNLNYLLKLLLLKRAQN